MAADQPAAVIDISSSDDESPSAAAAETPAASSLRPTQAGGVISSEAGPSRAASCPDACPGCLQCCERKRGTRTPGQAAASPVTAARRRTRARISPNEEPLKLIPMIVFNDESDKYWAPTRKSKGCSKQQHADDKEHKHPQPCSTSESVNDGRTSQSDALKLDQLREELTCVVCLDICYRPSTTSCGHSFCEGCLQSVYQNCGMRCPKCRQELRATSESDCPINTALWNTIQLLFPKETSARLMDLRIVELNHTLDLHAAEVRRRDEAIAQTGAAQQSANEGTAQGDTALEISLRERIAQLIAQVNADLRAQASSV